MAGAQLSRKGPGGAGGSRLNVSQQRAPTAKRADHILGGIKHSIASWSKEVIFSLYLALVWPQLEYCMRF